MKRLLTFLLILCLVLLIIPQLAFADSSATDSSKDYEGRPFPVISLLIVYTLMMIPNIIMEWLISIPFQMHKECAKVILLTSLCTQIGTRLLQAVIIGNILTPVTYLFIWLLVPVVTISFSMIECLIEFFIYRKKMLGFPTWQILLYTILANTASLVLGLLIIF